MGYFTSMTELEMVEQLVDELLTYVRKREGVFCDEEELSQAFDSEFEEYLPQIAEDEPAINEQFNNWTDGLCKEGRLHPSQYAAYTYVGKYS